MGACTSVPKDLKAEAGVAAAAVPEQPKEETTAEVAEVKADGGVPAEEEKKVVVEEGNNNLQSLGSFLNEGETSKEVGEDEKICKTEAVPCVDVKEGESNSDIVNEEKKLN